MRPPAIQWRITLIVAALLATAAADTPAPLLLRAQAWTEAGPDLAERLSEHAGECLAARDAQIEIGRALFRSPVLIGGPAARLGLSCNACHDDGGANARFLLPELTDRAGAADVTSEWSSRVRGDGVLNPVSIPDLADLARRPGFGRQRDPSLEHFVRGVIVEEFQGEAPPRQAFEALLAYLRALDGAACPGAAAITLQSAADDVRRAVSAAEHGDSETASLVLLAAQDAIGRIVERLPTPAFAEERRRFEALARDLGEMRSGDVRAAIAAAAPGWRARFDAAVARLAPREAETYFNQMRLAAALQR